MSKGTTQSPTGYQPSDLIVIPPLYVWPPRPIAALRWLFASLLFPWGLFFIALAIFAWHYLTPGPEQLATLSPGWVALIWSRNAALLTLVAGGLHYWLYIRRAQGSSYKFDSRWPATDKSKFLWRNQTKDNMFWSLVSGCTVWTGYESLTLWAQASGYVSSVEWNDAPIYLTLMAVAVFFWSTIHFYWNHRLLHWPPLFRIAHELHHRNGNTGPWTGISMHPLEHVIYFSLFALWWVVPVHPVIVILCGFYQGIGPSISHCDFHQVLLGKRARISGGDQFHQLHHRYFEVNYGNTSAPFDILFGTWHDGTPQAHAKFKDRRRLT